MVQLRFENRLNKDNIKFNTLNPVWDNNKCDALNVFEMIDLLNRLVNENRDLRLDLTHQRLREWRLKHYLKQVNNKYTDKFFEMIMEGKFHA